MDANKFGPTDPRSRTHHQTDRITAAPRHEDKALGESEHHESTATQGKARNTHEEFLGYMRDEIDRSTSIDAGSQPATKHVEKSGGGTSQPTRDWRSSENNIKGSTAEKMPSLQSPRVAVETLEARDPVWQDDMNKRLVRKIDGRLLPCLIAMYLLNFLDRSNLAQARQGTLEVDLGMSGTDFNLATSIFFVGYLLMQLPSNLLITKVRPSLYLASATVMWGVVSTCNAAVRSFGSLVAVRFCLGFVEAPFFPGAVFLMSSWYTRAELTRRMAWMYSGNTLANMFGGLFGAAILGGLEGAQGVAGWRWLFIIEGTITITVAIAMAFILPDYPHTTRWLSEEERSFAAWRLLVDINEADAQRKVSVKEGVKLALRDYRLYLFILLQHSAILSLTFQYFFPSIVGTLGYSPIITLWLTAPVWFAAFLVSVAATWSSARTRDRSLHIIGLMCLGALGNAIATATDKIGPRFFAMFLMPMGAVSAYQIVVSWVANSFPRPLVKRSAVIAICNMVGNTASIYGSYMYPASDKPRYIPGGTANTIICLTVAVAALVLRVVHKRENAKLEKAETEGVGELASKEPDRAAVGFRYVY